MLLEYSQTTDTLRTCLTTGILKEKGTGEAVTTMVMGKEKDIWEKEKGLAWGMDLVLEKEGLADLGLLWLPSLWKVLTEGDLSLIPWSAEIFEKRKHLF